MLFLGTVGSSARLRTPLISGALIAALAVSAALSPTAAAGPRVDYKHWFSSRAPGSATGSTTRILYKHPGDRDAKPIPVRREVFIFPRGTRFDGGVLPDCTATDAELQLMGPAACPERSRLGSGQGTIMTGFGAEETAVEFDMFDRDGGFLVVGGPQGLPIRQVARATRQGRVVTVPVPRSPGGPPDDESSLRRIHNVFPAHSRGRRTYIRTPRWCPRRGYWIFRARFLFADGVIARASHRMRCRRAV